MKCVTLRDALSELQHKMIGIGREEVTVNKVAEDVQSFFKANLELIVIGFV
jgi:hypothetical protein